MSIGVAAAAEATECELVCRSCEPGPTEREDILKDLFERQKIKTSGTDRTLRWLIPIVSAGCEFTFL